MPITLGPSVTTGQPRDVTSPADWLTSVHLSPSGDRLVLTARGQVFTVPVSQGAVTQGAAKGAPVTLAARAAGVRYREARFLPDGRSLIALADPTGEFEFWTFPADASAPPRPVTTGSTVTRRDGVVSPEGWL